MENDLQMLRNLLPLQLSTKINHAFKQHNK